MNKWINKLERKYGRYAIPDLIRYVVGLYCLGAALGLLTNLGIFNENVYYAYFSLNMEAVFHGQVWRLFTYLLEPYGFSSGMGGFLFGILFLVIQVNLFLVFGRSLEQAWGSFRFNLYFLSGWFLNILAALILYLSPIHSTYYEAGFQYIYWSMFFAFATINPDMKLYLWFILPIKVKWLAILDAVYLIYQVYKSIYYGLQFMQYPAGLAQAYVGLYFSMAAAILVSLLNFVLFYFITKPGYRMRPNEIRRRQNFRKKVREAERGNNGTRHRCAICGRTESDAPNLEFRYCSKCEGNYEYCSEHLFTHEHVRR